MKRAANTFSVLQAIVAAFILTIIIWSISAPNISVAEAVTAPPTKTLDTKDSFLNFAVHGVGNGQHVNTADITKTSSTDRLVPITINGGGQTHTVAQDLSVATNLANGFIVTVKTDQQLTAPNGADIDSFIDGSDISTASPWISPGATPGQENNYGHWGITSNDPTLTDALINPFNVGLGGNRFVSASTTPIEVFRHTGPVAGSGQGEGTARIGYKVEVSSLQKSADDYTATLTYEAVPVF